MSRGESRSGFPPDRVVEAQDFSLQDTRRVIETYHAPATYAMLRVVVAPCSPFSATKGLMQAAPELACALPEVLEALRNDGAFPPTTNLQRMVIRWRSVLVSYRLVTKPPHNLGRTTPRCPWYFPFLSA